MDKHLVSRWYSESLNGVAPVGRRARTFRESWTRRELLRGGALIVVGMSGATLLAACAAPATASPSPVAASPAAPSP